MFAVAPYNTTISEEVVNDRIIYTCYANGGPGNEYYWVHREGGSIEISQQQLVFTVRDQSNEGTYECTVTNFADSATVSIVFTGMCVCLNCHMVLAFTCFYMCVVILKTFLK